MAYFLFFLLAIICIISVLGMIISKNQAYCAIYLILAFVCIGGLFALLEAPFIAAVQIIIYAGAVMTLFIFVLMMINLRKSLLPEKKKGIVYFSIFVGIVLLVELFFSFKEALLPVTSSVAEKIGNPTDIGRLLFTKYLYPFEITSILIIAALVGAIVLAKKREKE